MTHCCHTCTCPRTCPCGQTNLHLVGPRCSGTYGPRPLPDAA